MSLENEKAPLLYKRIDDELHELSDSDLEENSLRQQGNFVSIFSMWNMTMGTSLLTIPWAFQQSGLLCGVIFMCILFSFALYTAVLILKGSKSVDRDMNTGLLQELSISCEKLLGKWTIYVNLVSTIILLGGALIVYWILIVDLAHNTVNSIYGAITSGSSNEHFYNEPLHVISNVSVIRANRSTAPPNALPVWTKQYLFPLIFIPIFLPILQLKTVTCFSRLTTVGTISLFVLFAFVITKAYKWGLNISFEDVQDVHYVAKYRSGFPALTGLASMAFFSHSSVTTVFKHNKKQRQIVPCLICGYFLTLASYLFVGLGIFLTFPGKKSEIHQNFMDNIPWNDSFAIVVQVLFLFRMITVYPSVSYMLRIQVFSIIFKKDYPG